MMPLAAATVWAILQASSARELIDKLRSEKVEERDDAALKLADLGGDAQPDLERILKDPDGEIRARARGVIEEISRRKRILPVKPAPRRLTLELNDVPLSEALDKVLTPFGRKGDVRNEELGKRRVSLTLKEATLWDALRALCGSAKVVFDETTFNDKEWIFQQGRRLGSYDEDLVVGDVRIRVQSGSYVENGKLAGMTLQVSIALPEGSSPVDWGIDGFSLKDDQGRAVDLEKSTKFLSESSALLHRKPGKLTCGNLWYRSIPLESLGDATSFRLEGKVFIAYPHDLQRIDFEFTDPKAPLTQVLDGLRVTLTDVQRSSSRLLFKSQFEELAGGKTRTALGWLEDDQGLWLGDDFAMVNRKGAPGDKTTVTGGAWLPEGFKAGKIVVAQFVGEDRIVIPFSFKDLSAPKADGKRK